MDKRLKNRDYLARRYSIADVAAYPWTAIWERQGQKIEDFPNLKRRLESMGDRPRVKRASEVGKPYQSNRPNTDPEIRKLLLGQSTGTLRARPDRRPE